MGRPVASARSEPTAPVPDLSAEVPSTVAVNGAPVCNVRFAVALQSLSSFAVKVSPRFMYWPRGPKGDTASVLNVNTCRWSKAESPRSASMSLAFWISVPPAPPMVVASSMDFDHW